MSSRINSLKVPIVVSQEWSLGNSGTFYRFMKYDPRKIMLDVSFQKRGKYPL